SSKTKSRKRKREDQRLRESWEVKKQERRIPLGSHYDLVQMRQDLVTATSGRLNVRDVLDMVLEYAGWAWPTVSEHGRLYYTSFWLTPNNDGSSGVGGLHLLPGFHDDDLIVCAYDLLRRHGITILDMNYGSGWGSHVTPIFDGPRYFCSQTIATHTNILLLTA